MLSTPFLTDIDSRAAVKGSRDPLSLVPVWASFGRLVVGNRRQRVEVLESSAGFLLRSRVARRPIVDEVGHADERTWQRNRVSELVGFRVDKRGALLAETLVPLDAGKDEWKYLVFNLARAADRFEYVLTGKDEE